MEEQKEPRVIKLATLATVLMVVAIGFFGFHVVRWAFAPSEVLVINNAPVPVQPPEVKDGDKIYLEIDYCKKQDVIDDTTLYLIGENNSAKIAINWPKGRTPVQCAHLPQVPIHIPAQTPSGTYHADFEVCYDINPLKKDRCTTFISQSFRITNQVLDSGDAKVTQ